MKIFVQQFFTQTHIPMNNDTVNVMEFLCEPKSVARMIAMSDAGFPALSGVVKELEARFADAEQFPLNHNAPDANAPNRRNVGWMIRYVMRAFGYFPVNSRELNDMSERTKIGKASQSIYFATSAVYAKSDTVVPEFSITITSDLK